jgi:hypothetical protein
MEGEKDIVSKCRSLLSAYYSGEIGETKMPEDSNPGFSKEDQELCLIYFTLPMSLNYQRDSYKLWQAALKTLQDPNTRQVFDLKLSANLNENLLRDNIRKHKLALQPNKHTNNWKTISKTIIDNWGSITNLLESADYDFLKLQEIIQKTHKSGFPYLSGPKIFNYWCFILGEYCNIKLKNKDQIGIAPDTHVTKASIKLGILSKEESTTISKEDLSQRWKDILKDSGINPIDMHPPLWFWSRNKFIFDLDPKDELESE